MCSTKISSIGPNFQGKRDNIDAAINVDDNTVRQLAYIKTASETNYDKKRKIAKENRGAASVRMKSPFPRSRPTARRSSSGVRSGS